MKSESRKCFYVILSVLLLLALVAGSLSCISIHLPSSGNKSNTTQTQSATGKTRPHPPVRTGDISLGQKADIATQSIGTSGGTITIAKSGDLLDGMKISVPSGAYGVNTSYKVSSAPVTGQTFGNDFKAITPMITIDNGGSYAQEIITVTIPVKIPEGYFAMGFYYDEKKKQLEGMPLIDETPTSITIATRHFSSFLVSMIEIVQLSGEIDSGFRPGIDDWQFENRGSYIAFGGHCAGQSLAAMWYFIEHPDGADACLYNRYDNNGKQPSTPNLWEDDSYGYRFASVIQKDIEWTNFFERIFINIVPKSSALVWEAFAYAIKLTGEPQSVGMYNTSKGGGHSMVVYKVVGSALYVADPNYPGSTDRKIQFYSGDGTFKPYDSGANAEEIRKGNTIKYDKIIYQAKTALIPWPQIANRWAEFKTGTIGNDKFPKYGIDYKINVVNDDGKIVELTDGFSTKNKMILTGASINTFGTFTYRDGIKISSDKDNKVELQPGNNLLGIHIVGKISDNWTYVDFKYFNVKYGAEGDCKPPPADVMTELHKTTKFQCLLQSIPTTIEASGSLNRWVPGFVKEKPFYAPKPLTQAEARTITWSGTSFSGVPASNSKDSFSGSVCYKDGKILVSFDYVNNDPIDNLIISVKNVPCDPKVLMDPKNINKSAMKLWSCYNDPSVVKNYVTQLSWKMHEEKVEAQYNGNVRTDVTKTWDARLTAVDWTKGASFCMYFYP